MTTTAKKSRRTTEPEADRPSTREELEQLRKGVLATAPSGARYRLRQLNVEQHALAGGLPKQLLDVAMRGAEAVDEILNQTSLTDLTEEEKEHHATVSGYLDEIVVASVIEPVLVVDDLHGEDPLVPANDYRWLVKVALRDEVHDAKGVRLFGPEPLGTFHWFRHFHDCPEDCTRCGVMVIALSSGIPGLVDPMAGA